MTMNKIWRIIKSRFKKDTGESWVEERRKICKVCPFNSKNKEKLSVKNKFIKIFSDLYTTITFSEYIDLGTCSCECPIWYKTADEEEECWAKEEKNDDKWKSIYIPNNKKK